MTRRVALALSFLLTSACAPELPSAAEEPIINGSRETGHPEVVAVYWSASATEGGLCTGTVIGPYAILTAKHCVMREVGSTWTAIPTSSMTVIVGSDLMSAGGITSTHRVREVRTTPGSDVDRDIENGADIAIVLLSAEIPVTPRAFATSGPSSGEAITIVGFGRTSSSSDAAGVKYLGRTSVARVGASLVETMGGSWTCEGDSGGPAIDPRGAVAGITSFGFGNCRVSYSYYTRVSAHRSLIETALAFVPPCEPSLEICDGLDNDCNGRVDDAMCAGVGDPCADDDECVDGFCEDVSGTRVCVTGCFPEDGFSFCPAGFYCQALGCGDGRCVRGGPGAAPNGTPCASDGECASSTCIDLGGTRRCARQCIPGATICDTTEICEVFEGGCGGCIPEELSTAPRAFGAPCENDARCRSGACAPEGFCTQACSDHDECPGPYHCRAGTCVSGELGESGDPCVSGDDCRSAAPSCVDIGGASTCAAACGAERACPMGQECQDTSEGPHCVPPGLGLGAACSGHDACRSGLCVSICTTVCSASSPCPSGFLCEPSGTAMGCFRPGENPATTGGSGGGCSVGARPSLAWLALASLGLGLLLRRRRRK